jgi:phosphatidylserine/phosphatidylglycerophosphate/cardiolipin synthase-like enzyme
VFLKVVETALVPFSHLDILSSHRLLKEKRAMDWLLLATGFTGGMTILFVVRWVHNWWITPPVVAVHFSPKGGCTDAIVDELKRAHREILVLAYSFSSKPIAQALIDAKMRGVHVEVILDRSNEQEAYSDLPLLVEQGLAPLIDSHHAIAHNKVMIIDRATLLTGSFNFTHQAESENGENLVVIKGHPDLIRAYVDNFSQHRSHSQACQKQAGPATEAAHKKAA